MKANTPSRVPSIKDPPWITRLVKAAVKRKHRVFRKFMNSGRKQEDWENFKIIRNETSRMVANAKEQYYSNLGQKLSDPTTGIKTFWSTMNRLINKKKTTNVPPLLEKGFFMTSIEAKTNIINKYFVQMCSETSTSSTLPNFIPRSQIGLEGFTIRRESVLQLIRSLDSKKAHGCDETSIAMIIICDISIAEPLCLIFEDCLRTGMYPCLWKKTNIVPIHKKESRVFKTNYRPISLLPVFGKLVEKIMLESIYGDISAKWSVDSSSGGFPARGLNN